MRGHCGYLRFDERLQISSKMLSLHEQRPCETTLHDSRQLKPKVDRMKESYMASRPPKNLRSTAGSLAIDWQHRKVKTRTPYDTMGVMWILGEYFLDEQGSCISKSVNVVEYVRKSWHASIYLRGREEHDPLPSNHFRIVKLFMIFSLSMSNSGGDSQVPGTKE